MPTIGIVTVLYNSATVVDEFIKTLAVQTYRNFVLYVIDNHSPDNSLAKVKELAKQAPFETVLFEEKENWGVAKGNNIGIERALVDGCDYVLLLNNDTALEAVTIENLLIGIREQNATMAVPKIYFYGTDLIWACGGRFNYIQGHTSHIGSRQEDKGQFDHCYIIKYSPTCSMLIHRDVFHRVGLMDEKYFVYYDDSDFVWRATMRGHEKMVYIPDSRLWHKESTSTGGQQSDFTVRYMARNSIYFVRKNLCFPQKQIVLFYRLLHNIVRKPFVLSKHQLEISRQAEKEGRALSLK